MFSKIKSMFANPEANPQNNQQMPFKHPKIGQSNQKQCPFMSNNKSKQPAKQDKCPVNGKTQKKEINSDSEQQEKPRGGCPFMGGSDKKRNPSLGLTCDGYDEPFVSKFKYYLSSNKLDFSAIKKGKSSLPLSRETFDKYPIYLKHTLFYNGEDYKKVRGLECCSRFMAYEELREKGNKFFNKGKYYQALDYYERAYSLFRWLEYHEPLNESRISSVNSQKSMDELSDNGSKIEIPLGQKEDDPSDAFGDLKQKYKQFFITYNDDNVKECNGQELTESADIDMRKSLLVQLYLNMAAAYINLHHYSLAERIVNDGLELSDRVSQLYFRKAQSIGLSKSSTLERLYQAKLLAQKAIQMRPQEKIFSTANANILKMLNLHDSEVAYRTCLQQINETIKRVEVSQSQLYDRVYSRAKQINLIEKRMIQQGKTPKQNLNQKSLYNCTQVKILQRMLTKYQKVIQFYTQSKNPEQVQLAKKEFQECLRVSHQSQMLFRIELKEIDNELGDVSSQKIQKRVNIIKTRFSEQIYNSGKYNFTMLQWAIKEIVKEEAERQKASREEEARLNPPVCVETKKGYSNLIYLLFLIPLALMVFNYFII